MLPATFRLGEFLCSIVVSVFLNWFNYSSALPRLVGDLDMGSLVYVSFFNALYPCSQYLLLLISKESGCYLRP